MVFGNFSLSKNLEYLSWGRYTDTIKLYYKMNNTFLLNPEHYISVSFTSSQKDLADQHGREMEHRMKLDIKKTNGSSI